MVSLEVFRVYFCLVAINWSSRHENQIFKKGARMKIKKIFNQNAVLVDDGGQEK